MKISLRVGDCNDVILEEEWRDALEEVDAGDGSLGDCMVVEG